MINTEEIDSLLNRFDKLQPDEITRLLLLAIDYEKEELPGRYKTVLQLINEDECKLATFFNSKQINLIKMLPHIRINHIKELYISKCNIDSIYDSNVYVKELFKNSFSKESIMKNHFCLAFFSNDQCISVEIFKNTSDEYRNVLAKLIKLNCFKVISYHYRQKVDSPGEHDILFVENFKNALSYINTELVDNILISPKKDYHSFKQKGKLVS